MKIILTQTVNKLGNPGDVVTVANGYGRNYLIPNQLAILANKGNLKQAERLAAQHERHEAKLRGEAQTLADRIAAQAITITARVSPESEKLYGSVTNSDIADALQEQRGIEVDRRRIELEEPIRTLGEHAVPVRLHTDVTAEIKVNVVAFEEAEAPA